MSDFFDHLEALDGTWEDREASSKLASFLTNAKYELDQKIGTFLSLAQTEEEFEARWGLCSIDLASVTAGLDEDSIGTLKESMKAQWFRPSGAKAKAKPAKVQASVQKTSLSFEEFKSETQKLMVAELTDSEMYDLYDSGLTPEDAASFSENSMPQGGYDPTNPDMPFQEDHEDLPSWTSSKLGSEDEDEEEAKDLGERYHQQATSKKASTGRTAAHLVVKPFMADDEDFPSPGDAGLQYETWDYDEDQDAYFVRGVDPDEESEWIEFFEGDHAFGNTEMVRIGSTRRTALRWEEPSYSTPDFPQWQGFDEQGQMVAEVTPYEDMDHGYGQVFEFAIYKDGVDPYTQDEGDHPTAQRAMEAADRWWSQNVGGTFSSKSPRGRRPFGDQKTASDQGRLVRDVDSAASDGSVVTLKSGTPVEVVQDDGNGLVVMVADSEAVQPEYFTEEFGVQYEDVRLAGRLSDTREHTQIECPSCGNFIPVLSSFDKVKCEGCGEVLTLDERDFQRTANQWQDLQAPAVYQVDRGQPLSRLDTEDWHAELFLTRFDDLRGEATVLYQVFLDPDGMEVEHEGEVLGDSLTDAVQKAKQEVDQFLRTSSNHHQDGEVVPFLVDGVRGGRLFGHTHLPEDHGGHGRSNETYWEDGVMPQDFVPHFSSNARIATSVDLKNLSYNNRVKPGDVVHFPLPTLVRIKTPNEWSWTDRVVEPHEPVTVIGENNAGFRGIEFSGQMADGEKFYNLSTGFLDDSARLASDTSDEPEMDLSCPACGAESYEDICSTCGYDILNDLDGRRTDASLNRLSWKDLSEWEQDASGNWVSTGNGWNVELVWRPQDNAWEGTIEQGDGIWRQYSGPEIQVIAAAMQWDLEDMAVWLPPLPENA